MHDSGRASRGTTDPANLQPAKPGRMDAELGNLPAASASEMPKTESGQPGADASAGANPPKASAGSEQDPLPNQSSDLPAGGAKRTTQDAAAAARERYLARKRKAPTSAAG